MAYKLAITDNKIGLSFNVKFENLAKYKRPEIVAKNTKGEVVKNCTVYQGTILPKGSTQKKWMDDTGKEYSKSELTFWLEEQQVQELSQTKNMCIDGYQPLKNYTDNYVISVFYEIFPSDNDMKKDIDRQRAIQSNTFQMRRLWEYLKQNSVVARGEFIPSTKGFVASDGYIRAIEFNNKWGLEVGVFKEEKVFQHLQENKPVAEVVTLTPVTQGVRIKRI